MRKLRPSHEVWYTTEDKKMSTALRRLAKAVKTLEDTGYYIESAVVKEYIENRQLYYTGLITADGGR